MTNIRFLLALLTSSYFTITSAEPNVGYSNPSSQTHAPTDQKNACIPIRDLTVISSWLEAAWEPHGVQNLESMCQCLYTQRQKSHPKYTTCKIPQCLSRYDPVTIAGDCPCFEQLAGYSTPSTPTPKTTSLIISKPSSSSSPSSRASTGSTKLTSAALPFTSTSHSVTILPVHSSSSTCTDSTSIFTSTILSTKSSGSSAVSSGNKQSSLASSIDQSSRPSVTSTVSSVFASSGTARAVSASGANTIAPQSSQMSSSTGAPITPSVVITISTRSNTLLSNSVTRVSAAVSSSTAASMNVASQLSNAISSSALPSVSSSDGTTVSSSAPPLSSMDVSKLAGSSMPPSSRGASVPVSSSSVSTVSVSTITVSPTTPAGSGGSSTASVGSDDIAYASLPGSTSTLDGPFTFAPAPTQTLTPAPPFGVDQGSPKVLFPQPNIELWYGAPSNASANLTASYARLNITYQYPAVALDHSVYITKVTCAGSSMTATFNNTDFYSMSKTLWTANSTMIWITAASSCAQQPGVNVFFLCNSISCDDSSSSCTANGASKSLASILDSMDTDFGAIEQDTSTSTSTGTGCGSPPSPTIASLPALACAIDFDKQLDDTLGYYAGDIDTFMNQFAPSAPSTSSIRKRGKGKSIFSKAWSAVKSTASDVGHSIANTASQTYHAAKSFAKDPTGTMINAAKGAGKYLIDKGKKIAKDAAQFATGALKAALNFEIGLYKTLYQAAKFLVTGKFDDDVELPFNLGPPSFLLLESPFMNNAKGFKFYEWRPDPKERGYSAWSNTLEVISQDIITTNTAPKPGVEFWCVDCGIKGDLKASGHVHVNRNGLQQATLGIKGTMYAGLFLGVNAFATWNKTYTKPLFVAGLPVLSIPDVFSVGPYVELDIRAQARIDALGQAIAGGSLNWPAINASVDFMNTKSASTYSHGLKPDINATIQTTEQITLTLSLGAPITLAVGVNLLDGLYTKNINLTDTPALVATARYEGDTNTTFTKNGTSGDHCTSVDLTPATQCLGVAWNITAVNDVTLGLLGFDTFNLDHWESEALAHGCIGKNTTEQNITTKVDPCSDDDNSTASSSSKSAPSSIAKPMSVASIASIMSTISTATTSASSSIVVSSSSSTPASTQLPTSSSTSATSGPSSSSCVAAPSSVITNGVFKASSGSGFQVMPAPWSGNGAAFYFDCSSPEAMFDNPECMGASETYIEYLCSQDSSIDAHTASISQTLNGLVPGSPYQLTVVEAFDNQATCILSYMIDNVPFRSFKPTNTYQSSINQMLYINDTAWFVPTASSHSLGIKMDCPYAGDNGGYGKWKSVDVQGPFCTADMPTSASNTGCPSGYVNGPTDRSESLFNVACNAAYSGGTFLASANEPTLDACLDWCNSWGGACQTVNYQGGYCTLYSTKGSVTPGSGASGQTVVSRL